nr:hypothetical protein [Tanacetum cinerariifolium]
MLKSSYKAKNGVIISIPSLVGGVADVVVERKGTACLNDLSYIPLNNEQNKPTQGDIGETSNYPTQAKRNEFEELSASANEELYPSCDYVTRLDFMAKFTYFKAKGLAADGFNPFGNLSQSYSMWPVILTTYNLPSWLCMKESSFMLTLLISGPKSLGKDIDVYLRPLIDDLKDLWAKPGFKTIDVATVLWFNMIAMVLWTINDFTARSSLSGWSWQGYKACPTCNEDTSSVRVLGKTAYVGHRRFLKKPHKWRRSLEFNGETKNGDPPREFSQDAIMTQLARLPTHVMHIEKNMLESILNTLLMNDKSKDTTKARQDLKRLGIRSGLWHGQNKNEKCSKPQAAYSFAPEDRKTFCQFIKGVKFLDGFGSNFKHKVTDNDTNITGLKSHDCHIMMQCLLPYGFQQYLAPNVAKPLIELCLFFKQICSQTLMVDDMLKAQSKAIFGGPIRPRWISRYFRDVTTKFNRLDRNVDCPPPTCQLQVFKSLCKLIGLRSVIRIDHQELKKVICEFSNKDMKEEFLGWFGKQIRQRHVDNDPGVNESSELFDLACGPSQTPIPVNSYVVNGVRFVVHRRDERRTTQNNDICSPGLDGEMYHDMARRPLGWKVVEHVSHKKFSNGGVIVVEDDPDVIHVDNSSDLTLSTSLNDLEIAALHIDGQSIDVDAPPDIIDIVDEDDDIIDEEDLIPHDLADSDDEDLVNLDIDDGVNVVYSSEEEDCSLVISADVARGHGGDGGGDDRPPPYQVPTDCGGYLGNRGKGTRKPNLGGRSAGRLHTRQETRNLGLKAIMDKSGPVLIRELPLHYPSWRQILPEQKARVVAKIGIQFDLRPHMKSDRWPQIYAGIQQHLQKIYNGKKTALKERYWVPEEDGSYDLERI